MDSKLLPYWFERHVWDQARNKARVIWEAIRDRTLPEVFRACNVPGDTRASKCVFKELCFFRWSGTQFSDWCDARIADQPDRKWLDLSNVVFPRNG